MILGATIGAIVSFALATAGGGYTLRPVEQVESQWDVVGASSAYDALDDTISQPFAPSGSDYISSGGSGRTTEVRLGSQPLDEDGATGGTAWFYAGAGIDSSARVQIVWDGIVRGSTSVSGGSTGSSSQWRSISVTAPDQAATEDLRLRFVSTGGGDVTVGAAYVLLTTEATPPSSSCPISDADSKIGMTVTGCKTIASDTVSNADPLPFWDRIECQDASRHQVISSGGDTHATGTGASQGNSAFRRLTAIDGDDFDGERCELGHNNQSAPTAFYHEGQRRVTFASIRMPASSPISTPDWRVVLQMKQAQPYNNPNPASIFDMSVRSGRWWVGSNWNGVWDTPAQQNVWTRFAFDIVYSQDPAIGSIKVYVDLNGDGDANDTDEQSPRSHQPTLPAETSPAHPDGVGAGESIPSHLRAGIYQNASIPCLTRCSVDIDNVQVLAP